MVELNNGEELGSPPAPWESFSHWVNCICVITFDLELGQTIEVIYPGDSELSVSEKLNICYLSFPDSNSIRHCTRDTAYHFRVRRSATSSTDAQIQFKKLVPIPMQPDPDFLYGFVHFRQQKNPSLPRGYYQKSIVLLTPLPLFGLFSHVVHEIAHGFFESGENAIESACQQIDRWPLPLPGESLCLPFVTISSSQLESMMHCRIPSRSDIPQRQFFLDSQFVSSFPSSTVLPTIHETNFYSSTKSVIRHIQLLWEIVLLGEPLLTIASTPALCSQLVQSLVSLIWPLRYANDFRPFFTIHDSDFNEIISRPTPPKIIIGVTNPFFSKAFKHWPHILRVGETPSLGTDGAHTPNSVERMLKKMADSKKLDNKPGFYSQYKPFLSHDKSLLKKLLKVGERPDAVQNAILRRHFLELTQSFMIPLERYISSLMPLKKQISPFKAVPQTKPFVMDEFLATLPQTGPLLTCGIKGDWTGFYRKFICSSPNFQGWLTQRLQDVSVQLKATHLEVLCTTDLSTAGLSSRQQVEIVDLVLKLKDRLADLDVEDREKRDRVQLQLNNILGSVDDELKSLLLSNAALRDAFQI